MEAIRHPLVKNLVVCKAVWLSWCKRIGNICEGVKVSVHQHALDLMRYGKSMCAALVATSMMLKQCQKPRNDGGRVGGKLFAPVGRLRLLAGPVALPLLGCSCYVVIVGQ